MSAFWIVGIGINVIAMAALVVWAVKAWKHTGRARHPDPPHDADSPD